MVDVKKLIEELERTHPRTRVERILILLRRLNKKKDSELIDQLKKMLEQSKRELAFMREWTGGGGGLEQSMVRRGRDEEEIRVEAPRQQMRPVLEETVGVEPRKSSSDKDDEKGLYSSGDKLYEEKFYSENADKYKPETETGIARESGSLVEGGADIGGKSEEKKYHRVEENE